MWGEGGGVLIECISLSVNAIPVGFNDVTFNHFQSVICPLLITIANSLDPDLA